MAPYLLAGLPQACKVLVSGAASKHTPQGVDRFNAIFTIYRILGYNEDSRLGRKEKEGKRWAVKIIFVHFTAFTGTAPNELSAIV